METLEGVIMGEIAKTIDELNETEAGSKEYDAKAKRLDSLMDKIIEMDRINNEQEVKCQQINIDAEIKREQIEEDRKDRKVKNILSAFGIVLPVAVTVWGTLKSFKFEQEGTITTIMGRGFIQKLLPKK